MHVGRLRDIATKKATDASDMKDASNWRIVLHSSWQAMLSKAMILLHTNVITLHAATRSTSSRPPTKETWMIESGKGEE